MLQSHTPRHIIAGIVMGLIVYYLAFGTFLIPIIQWYHLLLLTGLSVGIYFGILFVLKEFKKQDLDFFRGILHLKEMLRYVSSEIKDSPKK